MANYNDIIDGSDLMMFYNGKSISFATSHQLTLTGTTLDVSTKDHGTWGSKKIGKLSWSITSDNLFMLQPFKLFTGLWMDKNPITVVCACKAEPDANPDYYGVVTPTNGWSPLSNSGYTGKAIITNITVNAKDGESATYSITLEGTGALTPYVSTPPPANN
jgi:predicted secreted protein